MLEKMESQIISRRTKLKLSNVVTKTGTLRTIKSLQKRIVFVSFKDEMTNQGLWSKARYEQ